MAPDVKRRRTIFVAAAMIVAVIAFTIGRPFYRIGTFDAAMAKITRDTNETSVIELMGKPEQVVYHVDAAFWDDEALGDDVARQVVKQYWYTVKLPPVPISWRVGFDSNGRVVSKHRWD